MQPDAAQLASMLNSAAPPQPQAPEAQAVVQQTMPQQAAIQPVAAQPAAILSNAAPPHPQPHHPQLATQQTFQQQAAGQPTAAQLVSMLQQSLYRQDQAAIQQTALQQAALQSQSAQLASMLNHAAASQPQAAQAQPIMQQTAPQQVIDLTQAPQSQAHAAAAQSGAGDAQQQPSGARPAARVPKMERHSEGTHWRTQVCDAKLLEPGWLSTARGMYPKLMASFKWIPCVCFVKMQITDCSPDRSFGLSIDICAHSNLQCPSLPFQTTPHHYTCANCKCLVCKNSAVQCGSWGNGAKVRGKSMSMAMLQLPAWQHPSCTTSIRENGTYALASRTMRGMLACCRAVVRPLQCGRQQSTLAVAACCQWQRGARSWQRARHRHCCNPKPALQHTTAQCLPTACLHWPGDHGHSICTQRVDTTASPKAC